MADKSLGYISLQGCVVVRKIKKAFQSLEKVANELVGSGRFHDDM
jgi:hypothetical protein